MTKRSKKAGRLLAIEVEKAKRMKDRLERSPIDREGMLSLVNFVGSSLYSQAGGGRDYTHTKIWAARNGVDFDRLRDFLSTVRVDDDWGVIIDADPYDLFGVSEDRLAWMPIERNKLVELLDWLDDKLGNSGCARNYDLTRKWLSNQAIEQAVVLAAMVGKGGGCDCEILYNVDPDEIYPPAPENRPIKLH